MIFRRTKFNKTIWLFIVHKFMCTNTSARTASQMVCCVYYYFICWLTLVTCMHSVWNGSEREHNSLRITTENVKIKFERTFAVTNCQIWSGLQYRRNVFISFVSFTHSFWKHHSFCVVVIVCEKISPNIFVFSWSWRQLIICFIIWIGLFSIQFLSKFRRQ